MKFAGNTLAFCFAALAITAAASAQQKPYTDDLNEGYTIPPVDHDYTRREVMIPMRDGAKLFTVIWIPKGAHDAPIVLTRTPYNAAMHRRDEGSATLLNALPLESEEFVKAGYIRVYQDIRGKYGSQGTFVMTRPPV